MGLQSNWASLSTEPNRNSWARTLTLLDRQTTRSESENHRSSPMDQHQSLYQTHVKLLCFDLLSLTQTSSSSSSGAVSFSRNGHAVSCAEIVGVVVSRDLKPNRFFKFSVDDGTGCVSCILWLNQLSSPYFAGWNPRDVRIIANMATHFASQITVGIVGRVRGKVTSYRGVVQITVSDVVVENDPNAEILHWLDCMRLALKYYDLLPIPT